MTPRRRDPARGPTTRQRILEAARELCVDLIITTTHGRTGFSHLFMGSTVEKIVQRAPCPVLVLSQPEHEFV